MKSLILALLISLLGRDGLATPISLVKFEAESGALGSDFAVSNSTSPSYITITTDSAGNAPSNSMRVATYTVTFPTPGKYQLYAHIFVGPGGFADDSMFYGNGFGVKNPMPGSDWVFVNGLAGVGFTTSSSVVTGGGTAGSGVWKWVNVSQFAPGPTFTVTTTNLTQTFMIGGRENGLNLDSFVFGLSSFSYTVANLDAGVDGTPPSAGVCTINWTNTLQRIDGFGGGVVFLDAGLDPMTDANMDTLYKTNTTSQLGLTLLRVRIDPTTNWSDAVSDAKKAVARGGRVMATPWTPPASMKTNNNTIGGSLSATQFVNFASYLNFFAGNMRSNGVQLAAISIQNEPDFIPTYEGCGWSSNQFLSFFRTNAAAITNAPIMMPESFFYNQAVSDLTLNDPVGVTNVSIVAGHLYGGTIADYPSAHNKGKPTWMTEYLVNDQSIDAAIDTGQQINDCLATGNMSAYIWWKCIGDANGLLNAAGVPQKRGFVMAQFSRFVRPGYTRISSTNTGNILITAYRNTNSTSFAIVAINTTGFSLTPTINLKNFPAVASVTPWMTSTGAVSLTVQSPVAVTSAAFSYTLPGLSVVTFVGQGNNAPVISATANETINAGVVLQVTNNATNADLPGQTLAFSLINAPGNATLTTLGPTNTLFTWRPLVSQANSTNTISIAVADNGSPSLSATNNFTVTVNPLGQSFMSLAAGTGQQLNLSVSGPSGPDYTLLTSTNLTSWDSVLTSNSPVLPFTLPVTNLDDEERFFRMQLGP